MTSGSLTNVQGAASRPPTPCGCLPYAAVRPGASRELALRVDPGPPQLARPLPPPTTVGQLRSLPKSWRKKRKMFKMSRKMLAAIGTELDMSARRRRLKSKIV